MDRETFDQLRVALHSALSERTAYSEQLYFTLFSYVNLCYAIEDPEWRSSIIDDMQDLLLEKKLLDIRADVTALDKGWLDANSKASAMFHWPTLNTHMSKRRDVGALSLICFRSDRLNAKPDEEYSSLYRQSLSEFEEAEAFSSSWFRALYSLLNWGFFLDDPFVLSTFRASYSQSIDGSAIASMFDSYDTDFINKGFQDLWFSRIRDRKSDPESFRLEPRYAVFALEQLVQKNFSIY